MTAPPPRLSAIGRVIQAIVPKHDRVAAELIRIQFREINRSAFASLLVVWFVARVTEYGEPRPWVTYWAGLYGVWYLSQLLLVYRFRKTQPDDAAVKWWGRAAVGSLMISGLLWGIGLFHFVQPEYPLSIGLLVCAMAALMSGSIGYRSTTLRGFFAFNALVACPLATRFFIEGTPSFDLLGWSTVIFAMVIANYGRSQHALIRDTLRIRFQNDELVEQLRTKAIAAEQANLAKSQFLAAASHDLRQPLYALGLFSSSLETLRLDTSGRDVVRRIQESIGSMESSFEGLLDLSKLEAGVVQPRIEPVDVDALFDRISQIFRPLAIDRGLELRLRSDGQTVLSDPALLEQVTSNLVSNALRATTSGGVLLAVRPRGGALRFEVWDTGSGIAQADLDRIFDDYIQLDNPERDRRRGLGLGLAIARRSVALLGARIDVVSRLGHGSGFMFSQPICAAGEAVPPARSIEHEPALRRGDDPLLLVEDDEDVRAALCNLLSRWGFAYEAEATAAAALAQLTSGRRFGLVITDQRLAGNMTGLELIQAMRAQVVDPPPALIITGEVDSPLLQSAAQAGIIVLHKPVQAARLRRLLGAPAALEAVAAAS